MPNTSHWADQLAMGCGQSPNAWASLLWLLDANFQKKTPDTPAGWSTTAGLLLAYKQLGCPVARKVPCSSLASCMHH